LGGFAQGVTELGGFKLRGRIPQNFERPLAAKLCVRPPEVLEVQERARGPLSPCQVCWGSDFPASGATKNVVFFCLFVCQFVTLPWLRLPLQSLLGGASVAAA